MSDPRILAEHDFRQIRKNAEAKIDRVTLPRVAKLEANILALLDHADAMDERLKKREADCAEMAELLGEMTKKWMTACDERNDSHARVAALREALDVIIPRLQRLSKISLVPYEAQEILNHPAVKRVTEEK